jgi:hypothetical protein
LEISGSSKTLQAVGSLSAPGNTPWRGLTDARSAKRFLSLCGGVATSNGLDSEGLVRYFLNRCIQSELRDEINDAVMDLFTERPISYDRVVVRIEQ